MHLPSKEALAELTAKLATRGGALKDTSKGLTKAKIELPAADPEMLKKIQAQLADPNAGDGFAKEFFERTKGAMKK